MDAQQFRETLTQLVENYRRCGLSYLPRPSGELRDELLQAIDAMSAESMPAANQSQPLTASNSSRSDSSIPGYTAGENLASAIVEHTSPAVTLAGEAAAAWSLPVLPLADREQRFLHLSREAAACRKCSQIVSYRQQAVFGSGNLQPTVCFVGEAPGADEDRQGVPFVGKAGQLLTKIISAMKMSRDEVYILNALKCRPPHNRTPVPDEIEHCRGFLESQLEILQPQYIVCLGAVAVRSVLQSQAPVGRLRKKFHRYRGAKVVVTYHPSYLLRNADAKRLVWDDMKMLMAELGIPVP